MINFKGKCKVFWVLLPVFICSLSIKAEEGSSILSSHDAEQFVISSKSAEFDYEVLLSAVPGAEDLDKPLPLLVVLDGYLMGMSAIETARLIGAAGEIEPILVAAVSPQGGFSIGNTRRLKDFSADSDQYPFQHPIMQSFLPRFKAAGVPPEKAIGGSDDFRRFLTKELLPEIQNRKNIDMDRLGILGHSAAGVFLLEAILEGDTPFSDFIVGESGTFLLFGTEDELIKRSQKVMERSEKRVFYADSSGTMDSPHAGLFGAAKMHSVIKDDLKLELKIKRYEGETHTSMVPLLIKDGLLRMYGTRQDR